MNTSRPWYKTVGVNGVVFHTKKALVQKVRSLVNFSPLNTPLSPEQFAFFMDLLSHHPEWIEKRGCGVRHIEVRMNTGSSFSTRGLWIVRHDLSEIDVSWVSAVDASPMPHKQTVYNAARHAVTAQIVGFRQACGFTCGICGRAIVGDMHVDHRPPQTFSGLLSQWLEALGHAPEIKDAGTHSVFANPAELDSWFNYHYLFADLQPTHPACNLSQGAGR